MMFEVAGQIVLRVDSAVGADFFRLERCQGLVQVGMDLKKGIEMGKVEQVAHKRAGTGVFQLRIFRLSPSMEKHEFADASAVNGTDAAEIEHYFTIALQNFPHKIGKCSSLVAINDASLAVNHYYITTMSSF